MQIISNIALISINETLIAQLLAFLIFLFVINRVMFKPLRGIMMERRDHIEKMHSDIIEAEEELENVQKLLWENELAVKKEAFSIKDKLESEGDEKALEIFDRAKSQIQGMREKAQQEVSKQMQEARKSLQQEADALVVEILEKVLERRLAR